MSDEYTDLPAGLERQLASIEREANEMTVRALVKEMYDLPPVPQARVRNTPAAHAARTTLRGASREAIRVKDVSLWVIGLGLALAALGVVLLRLDYVFLGLGGLITSGFLIGFAAIALYKANERVQAASVEMDRLLGGNRR